MLTHSPLEMPQSTPSDLKRLAYIGLHTSRFAHDIKNLLACISGYADLLGHKTHLDEKAALYLTRITVATTRAKTLSEALLHGSTPLQQERVPIEHAVRSVAALLKHSIDPRITLEMHFAPNVPDVTVDRNQLEQAILDLALNALDAIAEILPERNHGTLAFRLSTEQRATDRRRFAVLSVSDTGPGIAPETAANIFKPFFTTKLAQQGTGLGLSSVQAFTESYSGEISFTTTFTDAALHPHASDVAAESGSTFTLLIPASLESTVSHVA